MRTIQQYIDEKKGKRYYYSSKPIFCDGCEKQLNDFVVVRACWDKKKSFIKQLCFKCSDKHVQITQAEEKLVMSVVDRKPIGSKLVLIRPLELKTSSKDDSLFCNNIDTPYTNNKATRSFHPDYTVLDDSAPARIGLSVNVEKEAEKNKLIDSVDELDALLLGFKNEQILIGDDDEEEVKKLE
jgi:hypothetical protein